MLLTILQVMTHLHLLDRIHHTLHVFRVVDAAIMRSEGVQIAVWLRVVVLMIWYKLINLLWRLLSVVALWVVWQRHWFFVILIITFSDTLNNARDGESNWNQNYENCNNDYYSSASSTFWSFIYVHWSIGVYLVYCQCLILLCCWIQYLGIICIWCRSRWLACWAWRITAVI